MGITTTKINNFNLLNHAEDDQAKFDHKEAFISNIRR